MSSNGTKNRNKPSKLFQYDFEGLSYPSLISIFISGRNSPFSISLGSDMNICL